MFDPQRLEDRVMAFIRQGELLSPGQRAVVGVSGGADSLCLLLLLWRRHRELGLSLHAAHLDHGLRGLEGAADADFVAHFCQQLNLPATVERRPVVRQRGESPEQAARRVRYQFLAQAAASAGAGRVALAHTADDQAETVLLNLLRGAGSRGLKGMLPLTPLLVNGATLTLVRPLLEVSRQETEAYCQALGVTPRLDRSNLSLSYRRNWVRWQLLPLLEQANPRIRSALVRTARNLADDLALAEAETNRVWGGVVQSQDSGLWLELPRLRGLPPALRRHLLFRAAAQVLGTAEDVAAVHIEALLDLLYGSGAAALHLPHGLRAEREGERLWLGTSPAPCPLPPLAGEYPVPVPGRTELPGWRMEAELIAPPFPAPAQDPFQALIDWKQTGGALILRARRPGDRFQPLGLAQPKKLQDFMVDAHIARSWRERIPLLCSSQGILWVVGYRISEGVKISAETTLALRLRLRLLSEGKAP